MAGARWRASAGPPPGTSVASVVTLRRLGRDLDLAADDLLLQLVQGGRDVAQQLLVVLVLGVVDAALLDAQAPAAAFQGAGHIGVDGLLDGVVDPLEHRGEDPLLLGRIGGQALIGVDPDGELLLGGGRRDHAGSGAAGGVVDDVGALADLLQGQLLALGRVAEGLGGVAGVVDQDLDVLALLVGDVLDARLVAGLELLDEALALLAADEADGVGLGLEGGRRPDQKRALLFLEADAEQVLVLLGAELVEAVDHRELGVGALGGRLGDVRGEQEADPEDQAVALVGQAVQQLLAVGAVRVGLDVLGLELVALLLLGRLEAGEGGVVERLVAAAADVVDDADLLGLAVAAATTGAAVAAVVAAATGGRHQGEPHQQGADPHTPYPTHAVLLSNSGIPPGGSAARWRYLTTPWPGDQGPSGGCVESAACAASCWASSCSCSPTSP